jgi:transcriptional regulator with XRE-family HTH domain
MGLEKDQAFLEAFGKRVRELRTAKGLSMRALADILTVDLPQVSEVELAKRNTSILMAHRLAEALEVPLPELFTFEVKAAD